MDPDFSIRNLHHITPLANIKSTRRARRPTRRLRAILRRFLVPLHRLSELALLALLFETRLAYVGLLLENPLGALLVDLVAGAADL